MKYFQEADFPHYYIIITNCLPSVNSKKVKSGVSPPPPVSYLSWDYFICSSVTVISRYFLKCRTACCRLHPYFNIWGLFHLRLGDFIQSPMFSPPMYCRRCTALGCRCHRQSGGISRPFRCFHRHSRRLYHIPLWQGGGAKALYYLRCHRQI